MRKKVIVFTNGCFDIIHPGHIELFERCGYFGDKVIVGLNSDSSVKKLKGDKRPINNQDDRKTVLEGLRYIDEVIIFDEETPLELIKKVKPDILIKGGDYKEDDVVGADFVRSYGGKVIIVNLVEGKSTSKIIEKLSERE